eukprot:6210414-Pleurochrysis_carterae.AAC.4
MCRANSPARTQVQSSAVAHLPRQGWLSHNRLLYRSAAAQRRVVASGRSTRQASQEKQRHFTLPHRNRSSARIVCLRDVALPLLATGPLQ